LLSVTALCHCSLAGCFVSVITARQHSVGSALCRCSLFDVVSPRFWFECLQFAKLHFTVHWPQQWTKLWRSTRCKPWWRGVFTANGLSFLSVLCLLSHAPPGLPLPKLQSGDLTAHSFGLNPLDAREMASLDTRPNTRKLGSPLGVPLYVSWTVCALVILVIIGYADKSWSKRVEQGRESAGGLENQMK
jgi:hypothetical protein